MFRRGIVIGLVTCLVLGVAIWKMNEGIGNAEPAKTSTASAAAGAKSGNIVEGFRSAKFGDNEAAVLKAIEKDFGKKGDDVKIVNNATTRTKAIFIRVKDLLPDSGDAQIVYSLGYKSKALFNVYVLWGTPISKDATQLSLAKTDLALKGYFDSLGFDPKKTIRGRKLAGGGILSFQGTDSKGHVVNLVYTETKAKVVPKDKDGKPIKDAKPEVKTNYVLRLTYVQDPKNPDIFKIDKGAF